MANKAASHKGTQSCQAPNHTNQITTALENAGVQMAKSSTRLAQASSTYRAGIVARIATLWSSAMQDVTVPRAAGQQARKGPWAASAQQVVAIRATSSNR